MRATCTKDPDHDTFITTARVVEEWKVDREGNFLEAMGALEVVDEPDINCTWECAVCGCKAEVRG